MTPQPLSAPVLIVTLHLQNGFSNLPAEYTPPAPSRLPPEVRPVSREKNPLSKKRRLTEDQECQRMEGLRILARIIARHYLAHPELYPSPGEGATSAVRKDRGHKEETA